MSLTDLQLSYAIEKFIERVCSRFASIDLRQSAAMQKRMCQRKSIDAEKWIKRHLTGRWTTSQVIDVLVQYVLEMSDDLSGAPLTQGILNNVYQDAEFAVRESISEMSIEDQLADLEIEATKELREEGLLNADELTAEELELLRQLEDDV